MADDPTTPDDATQPGDSTTHGSSTTPAGPISSEPAADPAAQSAEPAPHEAWLPPSDPAPALAAAGAQTDPSAPMPGPHRVRWINPRRRWAAALVAAAIAVVGFGGGVATGWAVSGSEHHSGITGQDDSTAGSNGSLQVPQGGQGTAGPRGQGHHDDD